MTKDRIKDLQKTTSWPSVSYRTLVQQSLNHEVHNGNSHSTTINIDNESNVIDFLKEIDLTRSIIDKINDLAQEVKRIQVEMLHPMANPKLRQELDDKKEEIKKLAYETSVKLKKMEQAQENRDDYDTANAQWRIRESQICVLTRRFRDTMTLYNTENVSHRERCKRVIVRELELCGNRKSNDELEEMFENGCPGTFNFSILVDTQKARQSLNEIEARHRDIIKLENSIKELHNMYLDLAILVADQGEMIDCIEYNVSKAIDYVEDAAENVNIAEQWHKRAIKKKIVLLIILSISVVLIFILILIGYFTQKKIRGS